MRTNRRPTFYSYPACAMCVHVPATCQAQMRRTQFFIGLSVELRVILENLLSAKDKLAGQLLTQFPHKHTTKIACATKK